MAPEFAFVDSDEDDVLLWTHGDDESGVWHGIEMHSDATMLGYSEGTLWVSVYSDFDPDDEGNDADYLAGGIWLFENMELDAATPLFTPTPFAAGAFMYGSNPWYAEFNPTPSGTFTYSGDARGISSGEDATTIIDGDVTLSANLSGAADDSGMIGTIGGSIQFDGSELTLDDAEILRGEFSGTASMGSLAGHWGGKFYGPSDPMGPGAAAGTFGVTGADESLLGTFMAYRDDN